MSAQALPAGAGMAASLVNRLAAAPEPPASLLARLRTAPKRAEAAGEPAPGVELDTPAQIRRATELAARLCEDGPANDRYRKACRIKDEGVSEDVCLEIMREAGFHEDGQTSLEQKVASAYRNGQNAAGSKVAERKESIARLVAAAQENQALYPASLTRARDAASSPRKPYLIDSFVKEREVNLAPGDGAVGKDRFWMQVAVAVAAGQSAVFGLPIRRRVPAVFVSAEDDDGELYRRARGIALELGLPDVPDDLYLVSLVEYGGSMAIAQVVADSSVAPGPFLEPLLRLLKPLGDHLVILDAAADAADIDEQSKGQANAFLKRYVRQLCAKAASTAVLIAHPTKAAAKDRTFVSSPGWRNGVRSMVCGERVALSKGRWVPDPGGRGPDFYARFWQDKGNDLEHAVPELVLKSTTGRVGFTVAGAPVGLPESEGTNAFSIWAEAIAQYLLRNDATFIGLNAAAKQLAKLAEGTPKDDRAGLGYAAPDGKPRSRSSFYSQMVGDRGAGFREATVCNGDYVLQLKKGNKSGQEVRGLQLVNQSWSVPCERVEIVPSNKEKLKCVP